MIDSQLHVNVILFAKASILLQNYFVYLEILIVGFSKQVESSIHYYVMPFDLLGLSCLTVTAITDLALTVTVINDLDFDCECDQ